MTPSLTTWKSSRRSDINSLNASNVISLSTSSSRNYTISAQSTENLEFTYSPYLTLQQRLDLKLNTFDLPQQPLVHTKLPESSLAVPNVVRPHIAISSRPLIKVIGVITYVLPLNLGYRCVTSATISRMQSSRKLTVRVVRQSYQPGVASKISQRYVLFTLAHHVVYDDESFENGLPGSSVLGQVKPPSHPDRRHHRHHHWCHVESYRPRVISQSVVDSSKHLSDSGLASMRRNENVLDIFRLRCRKFMFGGPLRSYRTFLAPLLPLRSSRQSTKTDLHRLLKRARHLCRRLEVPPPSQVVYPPQYALTPQMSTVGFGGDGGSCCLSGAGAGWR